jgi:hypothetical protein
LSFKAVFDALASCPRAPLSAAVTASQWSNVAWAIGVASTVATDLPLAAFAWAEVCAPAPPVIAAGESPAVVLVPPAVVLVPPVPEPLVPEPPPQPLRAKAKAKAKASGRTPPVHATVRIERENKGEG